MEAIESIAHTLRGGTTIFFFAYAVALFRMRRRSRLMQLLFCLILLLALEFLKDALFLFPQFQRLHYWDDLVSLTDLLCVPMACAFFAELIRPGVATNRRIAFFLLVHFLCLLGYALWPCRILFYGAFALAFLQVAVTVGYMLLFVLQIRHHRSGFYSPDLLLNMRWTVFAALSFIGLFFGYYIAFETTTWLSESIFCVLFCPVVCSLYYVTRRQSACFFPQFEEGGDAVEVETASDPLSVADRDYTPSPCPVAEATGKKSPLASTRLADALEAQMSEQRLYLNPQLTLADLTTLLHTNRTSLARCLKQDLDSSFYDYVNRYRVTEACRLLTEAAGRDEVVTMTDVASQSGFNSITTFNRYFSKFQGMTPMNYFRELRQKQG